MKPLSCFLTLLIFISMQLNAAEYVIIISSDGLRPDAIEQLGKERAPNFHRLQEQGTWTHNARTDLSFTNTIPNHSSMITGRPVVGEYGHLQIHNNMPLPEQTLHTNRDDNAYIQSIFDVAHDHGLSTALYASKDKFILFKQSYSDAGAKDLIGEDNGQDNIDLYVFQQQDRQAAVLVDRFVEDMSREPMNLSFIHLTDADSAGHGGNWMNEGYLDAVNRVDRYLGDILNLVEGSELLAGKTALILTADHGGFGERHGDASNSLNYKIPFYVWGAGKESSVLQGMNLYELNVDSRANPKAESPSYDEKLQPIRNSDLGNLALDLLGLPAIHGSMVNIKQDLLVE